MALQWVRPPHITSWPRPPCPGPKPGSIARGTMWTLLSWTQRSNTSCSSTPLTQSPAFGLVCSARTYPVPGLGWIERSWAMTTGTRWTMKATVQVWRPCWRQRRSCCLATVMSHRWSSVRVSNSLLLLLYKLLSWAFILAGGQIFCYDIMFFLCLPQSMRHTIYL